MRETLTRRNFVRSSALAATALATWGAPDADAQERPSPDEGLPVRLGLASYTFRNFTRAQMIGFMKQLRVFALNAKNVKDHLPIDPQDEQSALTDYAAAGITLHAAGVIYFRER